MLDLIHWFLEPLQYSFMQQALVMSLMIGVACSFFSCFLVLKGWSLMGDAISHAVLPGLVLAYVIGIPLVLGAFISGLFCATSIGFLKENSRIKEDTVMGIVFSGMFALGLVLITKIETDIHLLHVLFGNVLGIEKSDLIQSCIISAVILIIMFLKRKDLLISCFDKNQAYIMNINVARMNLLLLCLLSLIIVSSIKAVGIILVIAMLIAPGSIAFLISKSFDSMLIIAVAASCISCCLGVLLSYHFDVATGPLIVVIEAGIFLVTLIVIDIPAKKIHSQYMKKYLPLKN